MYIITASTWFCTPHINVPVSRVDQTVPTAFYAGNDIDPGDSLLGLQGPPLEGSDSHCPELSQSCVFTVCQGVKGDTDLALL